MKDKQYVIGLDVILFVIFLMLKLDGIIDWQWIWIFSPFWIVWIAQIAIAIVGAIANMELRYKGRYVSSGAPLVWDPKTNTMYGPFEEDNTND